MGAQTGEKGPGHRLHVESPANGGLAGLPCPGQALKDPSVVLSGMGQVHVQLGQGDPLSLLARPKDHHPQPPAISVGDAEHPQGPVVDPLPQDSGQWPQTRRRVLRLGHHHPVTRRLDLSLCRCWARLTPGRPTSATSKDRAGAR